MSFRNYAASPYTAGANVFPYDAIRTAQLENSSGTAQTVSIVSEQPALDSPTYTSRTDSILLETRLEDGENRGLTVIRFADTFRPPNSGPVYSSPYSIIARQTGFETAEGTTFTGSNGRTYYLSATGNPQPGQTYTLYNDKSGGRFTEFAAPCFVTGTRITTTEGEVNVEKLIEGDVIVTAAGTQRPVRWIGHRTLNCTRHPRPEAVWPIRVSAGAFGEGKPIRDLWLSPDHAVQVTVLDPVLIPVKHLLNDATITQIPVPEVTYWHVELDSHDILLADGLPAESFLDTGVRACFENGAKHAVLHADFAPLTVDDFVYPLVQEGQIVSAVRTRLIARARALGWTITSDADLRLLADGVVIHGEWDGDTVRFALPAEAQDVRLVSRSFVPERVRVGAGDGRRLGVPLRRLSIADEHHNVRDLLASSDLLNVGFSHVQDSEAGLWRWTTGEALLPASLWAGCKGFVALMIETAPDQGTPEIWTAPVSNPAPLEPLTASAKSMRSISTSLSSSFARTSLRG